MTDFTNAKQITTPNDSQCEAIKMLTKSLECGKTGNSRSITNIKYTSNNIQQSIWLLC